jgi:sulfur carrier protein
MGIEPTYAAWEAAVLPLNYTRVVSLRTRMLLDFGGSAMIEITVNGEPHRLDTPFLVSRLLDQLGLTGKRLAVELNGEIVPRSQHASTALTDGDKLEIVVAVGGG